MPVSRSRRIPEATVSRLPIYERILCELRRVGTTTVSSEQLAAMARVNAAKVRKDLSLLGSFGTRGTGYDTAYLVERIDRALGLDQDWPVAIAGIGNLGRALANYHGFSTRGFRIAALLDVNPEVIGQRFGALEVRHVGDLPAIAEDGPLVIGVVTTPSSEAQGVTNLMVDAGIRSILNFAPVVLEVPGDVLLRYVDLSIELQVMSFYASRGAEGETEPPAGGPEADMVRTIRSVGISHPSERRRAGRPGDAGAARTAGRRDWRMS